jgi:alpha/beta hydrolase family protein
VSQQGAVLVTRAARPVRRLVPDCDGMGAQVVDHAEDGMSKHSKASGGSPSGWGGSAVRRIIVILVLVVLLASCSGAGDDSTTTPSPTSSPATTQAAPAKSTQCTTSEVPSCTCPARGRVVYLHGHSQKPGDASGSSAGALPSLVSGKGHRFCGYDRANTGSSDKVPGPLTGKTTLADLHRLLQAAQIKPPYVLLGASFGGLFAYMYAVTSPKEVAGMALLDASFPEELDLERFFPKDERWDHTE